MSGNKNNKTLEAKIITLGDGQVGKTSIIFRYIDNSFSMNYLATIGVDFKLKKIKLPDGEEVKVKIYDTAGQERFKSITANYVKKANGILFVYDVTDEVSFKNMEKWIANLKEETGDKLPAVLIGNKSDLTNERSISKSDGEEMAKKFGLENHFFETSCKTGENVEKSINDLVGQICEKCGKKIEDSNLEIKKADKSKKKKFC